MPMQTIAATVVGQSHLARGAGCEDALSITTNDDGRWTSAVLCDGCGSAKHAAEGAQQTSRFLASALVELAPRLDAEGPGEWVVDQVVMAVASLREDMRAAYGADLRDYSATVVAAMVSERGGFILHVGDGVATAFGGTNTDTLRVTSQSNPKNGEYANETFYLTGPDWVRNVWITPVSNPALVLLCTDGAQDFLYDGNSPATARTSTMLNACLSDRHTGESKLLGFLSSPDAARRSNDDKGCIIIYRPSLSSRAAAGALMLAPPDTETKQRGKGDAGTAATDAAVSPFGPVSLGIVSLGHDRDISTVGDRRWRLSIWQNSSRTLVFSLAAIVLPSLVVILIWLIWTSVFFPEGSGRPTAVEPAQTMQPSDPDPAHRIKPNGLRPHE